MTGVPDETIPFVPPASWYVELLKHGVPAFIVVVGTMLVAGFVWSLRGHIIDLISAKRKSVESMTTAVDTMTEELPAIRRGVEKLADEASGTLRKVHDDVTFIRGAVSQGDK